MWAPLLAALAVIVLAPSRRQLQQREAEVAALAAERARLEMVNRMPVTPVEAAQWWVPDKLPVGLHCTMHRAGRERGK